MVFYKSTMNGRPTHERTNERVEGLLLRFQQALGAPESSQRKRVKAFSYDSSRRLARRSEASATELASVSVRKTEPQELHGIGTPANRD